MVIKICQESLSLIMIKNCTSTQCHSDKRFFRTQCHDNINRIVLELVMKNFTRTRLRGLSVTVIWNCARTQGGRIVSGLRVIVI